jgi:hypothetical protein
MEWVVIILIIFCIVVWYYSQSTTQYSISQIKESQVLTNILTVWEEKNPVVISEVRLREIWSPESLKQTRFWGAQPIWNQYEMEPNDILIPNDRSREVTWAGILGISQTEADLLLRWFNLSPWIYSTRTEAHVGPEGLRTTYGWATAITCTHGEARCILLNSSQKLKLPPGWKGLRWPDATVSHHPLWTQVQHIEIILRPSTVLLVPPHWNVAIEPLEGGKSIWWTRTDIHHPISKWAQKCNDTVKIA